MKNEIEIGSLVRIGHLVLVVESIEGETFFGSDDDGDEREYLIKQIDTIL